MGRPELGTKCACVGYNERFYDLNRSPAIRPKCSTQQPPVKPHVTRPPRAVLGSKLRARQQPAVVVAEDNVEPVDASEAEDEVMFPKLMTKAMPTSRLIPILPSRLTKFSGEGT
jgi:uncharacterized protein (TIGR02300 family)